MSGTTSFEPNNMRARRRTAWNVREPTTPWGEFLQGIYGSWRLPIAVPGASSAVVFQRATPHRKTGCGSCRRAVDAENASTAPWKTAKDAVSHSYHKPLLFPSVTQSVTHVPG